MLNSFHFGEIALLTCHIPLLSHFKLRFTEMLKDRFGWDGPADGKKGPFDYLPLVIQADPKEAPELFEVPLEMCPPVHIHHPRYPGE